MGTSRKLSRTLGRRGDDTSAQVVGYASQASGLVCDSCGAELAEGLWLRTGMCRRCVGAALSRRQVAFGIDVALGGALASAVEALLDSLRLFGDGPAKGYIGFAVLLAYLLLKDAPFAGRSVGKAICGLRTIRMVDGSACGVPRSILRNLTMIHFGLAVLELFVSSFRVQLRRLGDAIAGTRVVETRELTVSRRLLQLALCGALFLLCLKLVPGFRGLLERYLSTVAWPFA